VALLGTVGSALARRLCKINHNLHNEGQHRNKAAVSVTYQTYFSGDGVDL